MDGPAALGNACRDPRLTVFASRHHLPHDAPGLVAYRYLGSRSVMMYFRFTARSASPSSLLNEDCTYNPPVIVLDPSLPLLLVLLAFILSHRGEPNGGAPSTQLVQDCIVLARKNAIKIATYVIGFPAMPHAPTDSGRTSAACRIRTARRSGRAARGWGSASRSACRRLRGKFVEGRRYFGILRPIRAASQIT